MNAPTNGPIIEQGGSVQPRLRLVSKAKPGAESAVAMLSAESSAVIIKLNSQEAFGRVYQPAAEVLVMNGSTPLLDGLAASKVTVVDDRTNDKATVAVWVSCSLAARAGGMAENSVAAMETHVDFDRLVTAVSAFIAQNTVF